MASSGSFNTNGYNDGNFTRYVTFKWSIKSQSAATNSTVINWSIVGGGGTSTQWMRAGNFTVVIDGRTVYNTGASDRIETYAGTVIASGTLTLNHNNSGNKSFSASVTAGIYTYEKNCSGSGSWALTQIPRQAAVSQSVSSKTETSIVMKWNSDSVIDYIWYSANNGANWTGINVSDGKSGSYTISGLTAGTTYNVKTRVRRKDSGLTTDSSKLSVATYDYPYCNSTPNFTIGEKVKLGFYNPLGRTFTFYVIANNAQLDNSWTISGSSYTGIAAATSINQLYATIPNAKSATYKIKCVYGNHADTRTGGTYTVNESDCRPSIGGASYADTNQTVIAITGDAQKIVQNQSVVGFAATGLTAQKSAAVRSCSVTVNGSTHSLTVSGSSAGGGNVRINSSGNVIATFTVTDSRGLTATKKITVSMLEWKPPTAIIKMQRQSNFYSETDITVDANYSYVNGGNQVQITYKARPSGSSVYTITGNLQDNVPGVFTADNSQEWDVVVTLTDLFGGAKTYKLFLSRGVPIIFFDRLKSSVGINCFPEGVGSLEVSGIDVLKALFFSVGDQFVIGSTARAVVSGYVSNGSKGIWFSVPLPRSAAGVTPALDALKLNIRTASGDYLIASGFEPDGYDVLADYQVIATIKKAAENILTIELQHDGALPVTNNTPLSIAVESMVVNFS